MPNYASTTVVNGLPMTFTTAFPAADNTTNTGSLDTNYALSSRAITSLALQSSWSALSNHTDNTKYLNIVLQTSNDNANWANASPLQVISVPGVTTSGAPADQYRMAFPAHTGRYVRVSVNNPASGPNLSGLSITTSVVHA